MAFAETLTPLLIGAAKILASSAAAEFAKGAGKTAYENIKSRLIGEHGAGTVALLDQSPQNPDYQSHIAQELAKAALERDETLLDLAKELNEAIQAMPPLAKNAAAIDANEIRATGNQLFKDIEGIRAGKIIAEGDQTFKSIKSPKT